MASRLSEETTPIAPSGGQHGATRNNADLPAVIAELDLETLLLAEDPEAAVQALAPQVVFEALVRQGPETALEILPLLSTEQVVRIFDYDAWTEDRLEPLKAARWLSLFKEVSNEELFRRFSELDEEYQLALLGPLVEVIDEDQYEKLSDQEQDVLHRLPCNTLYFRVKSSDPRLDDLVSGLVDAALECNIAYAYSMLSHASEMPPNEQEALLGQFRRARLEEDGFVSFEESLAAFRPVDLPVVPQLSAPAPSDPAAWSLVAQPESRTQPFLRRVLAAGADASPWTAEDASTLQQGLAFLGNSLCAAAQVETGDAGGLKRIMTHAEAAVGLGLEYLAGGDVRIGRELLRKEHPQMLFRVGLALVRRLADATLACLVQSGVSGAEELRRHLAQDRHGTLGLELERTVGDALGFERTEILKGLFERFPVRPVHTAAAPKRRGLDGRLADEWAGAEAPGAMQLAFVPVASLADLESLAAVIDGITGALYLAALADDGAHVADLTLDRRLLTPFARVLLGGAFRFVPLAVADLAQLVRLPLEAKAALKNDFFAGVDGSLRMALAPPGGGSWAASIRAGVRVADPVLAVITELQELAAALTAACVHASKSVDADLAISALAGLIGTASKREEVQP